MGYKEKIQAAESNAHNHAIATKILRDMEDMRAKVGKGDTNDVSRRWIWELIQNAKDVHNHRVSIHIGTSSSAQGENLVFRHNGNPFTANNIRFLIEQISDKDRKKEDDGKRKQTGKFGTGFLTTHLLSEVVTIDAVAKEPELDYRKFQLILDRSGNEIDEITAIGSEIITAMASAASAKRVCRKSKEDISTYSILRLEHTNSRLKSLDIIN